MSEQELLLSVTPYINALVAAYSLKFGYGTLVDQMSLNGREVRYWMTKSEDSSPEKEAEIQARAEELRRMSALFSEHTNLSPDVAVLVIRHQPDGTQTFGYEAKS